MRLPCEGCGGVLALADALCPGCGRFVVGDLSPEEQQHRAASRQRGGNLVAAAVLIGLFALFVVGMLYGAYACTRRPSERSEARYTMLSAHPVAEKWRVDHATSPCPTMALLLAERELGPGTKIVDPWGRPYRITCATDETYISSDGPDHAAGTADDLTIPE